MADVDEMLSLLVGERDGKDIKISADSLYRILLVACETAKFQDGFTAKELWQACNRSLKPRLSRGTTDRFLKCAFPYLLDADIADTEDLHGEHSSGRRQRRRAEQLPVYTFQPRVYWRSAAGLATMKPRRRKARRKKTT